jgi:hypothetical protein
VTTEPVNYRSGLQLPDLKILSATELIAALHEIISNPNLALSDFSDATNANPASQEVGPVEHINRLRIDK